MKNDNLMEMFIVEELEQRLEMKKKASITANSDGSVSASFSWEF